MHLHGRRNGLTLVELIVAIVLLSVLMAALSGLVPRFAGRSIDAKAYQQVTDLQWSRLAVQRLADDLGNAEAAQISNSGLQLTGRLGRDARTGRMNDQEDTCNYRLVPFDRRTLLLREQAGNRELLGCGHFSVGLETVSKGSDSAAAPVLLESPRPDVALHVPSIAQRLPLSPRMRVSLRGARGQMLAAAFVVRQPVGPEALQPAEEQE